MAIFDDYIQKEQGQSGQQLRLQREQDEKKSTDVELVKTLTPYVADALNEIGDVVSRLHYNYDYLRTPYVTGTIFKKTEYTLSSCWILSRQEIKGNDVRTVPSAVMFTDDHQFVTPYQQDGTKRYGEPAHYQGTKVSLSQAARAVAEEMKDSVNAWRFWAKGRSTSLEFLSSSLPGLVDKGDYQGAVKKYFEISLEALRDRKY